MTQSFHLFFDGVFNLESFLAALALFTSMHRINSLAHVQLHIKIANLSLSLSVSLAFDSHHKYLRASFRCLRLIFISFATFNLNSYHDHAHTHDRNATHLICFLSFSLLR